MRFAHAVGMGGAIEQTLQVHTLLLRSMGTIRRYLPPEAEHGNRRLHFADMVGLLLSAGLQPTVRSLRMIEQHSAADDVRAMTGRPVVPRSTLSDALAAFDPESLRPLLDRLRAQMSWLKHVDPDTHQTTRRVLAADGSWFNLAGEVTHALMMNRAPGETRRRYRVRLNLQLDVDTMLPIDFDVSGKGDGSEPAAFKRRIKPDCVYVVDRGFVHFGFINEVLRKGSNLVLRLRKDTHFAPAQDRPPSELAKAAGVKLDQTGTLSGPTSAGNTGRASRTEKPPTQTLRRIVVRENGSDNDLILVTDLLDMPAHLVVELYRSRWKIELFFRWLKVFACFDHLINQSPRGITTQFYVAVLLTLLLHLRSGMPVSKHTLHVVAMSAAGQLSDEAMAMLLARRESEREKTRLRRARKKIA